MGIDMSLKTQMTADISAVFLSTDEFAEIVTYNGTSITAVPEIGESNQKGNEFSSEGSADRATFHVSAVDVSAPVAGDTIVCNGKTWTVARVLASDAAMHSLLCTGNHSAVAWR